MMKLIVIHFGAKGMESATVRAVGWKRAKSTPHRPFAWIHIARTSMTAAVWKAPLDIRRAIAMDWVIASRHRKRIARHSSATTREPPVKLPVQQKRMTALRMRIALIKFPDRVKSAVSMMVINAQKITIAPIAPAVWMAERRNAQIQALISITAVDAG